MKQQEILQALQKDVGTRHIQFPKDLHFTLQNGVLAMELNESAIGLGKSPQNMHKVSAAFEGWAAALYAHLLHCSGSVVLYAPVLKEDGKPQGGKLGHYHRFLYRAMKFREQFPWFQLAPDVDRAVTRFQADLKASRFVNNLGRGAAGSNGKPENMVEALFAGEERELLRKAAEAAGVPIGNRPVYRQLTVGLFQERKPKPIPFFAGNKSAVDLWTYHEDTLSIFELKVQNKMIGMVTELFFYANYVYDMFCDVSSSFFPQPPKRSGNDRGYSHLVSQEGNKIYKRVHAFFLYDEEQIHPLISKEAVAILNQGTEFIQYILLSYPLHIPASV